MFDFSGERIDDFQAIDDKPVVHILAVEGFAAGDLGGGDDHGIVDAGLGLNESAILLC
ncbi:MAG: hypothetical protein ABL901_13535 [Hyphomicrobiaceae bacterium]